MTISIPDHAWTTVWRHAARVAYGMRRSRSRQGVIAAVAWEAACERWADDPSTWPDGVPDRASDPDHDVTVRRIMRATAALRKGERRDLVHAACEAEIFFARVLAGEDAGTTPHTPDHGHHDTYPHTDQTERDPDAALADS